MAIKNEPLYMTSELARSIGVAAETIRLWQRKGVLAPRRTVTGTRVYSEADKRDALRYQRERLSA